ncbi:MAG TPA: RNA 2',3'-cyclic phosphodiesterase [Micromonosporaceae bacterium]|nr:RNA 2',3'-cyclic phosphodiesterase [Micromonosporaceae bacterium]
MRLFVGIFPSPAALADLSTVVGQLPLTRRVIPPERWHITVAFLGEVSDDDETAARRALDEVSVPVGEVCLRGGGRFGSVLWTGISGDVAGLSRLNRTLRRELRAHRLHPDDKRFRPHLTIARAGDELSTVDMELLKAYEGPSWPVTELVLVRSELGPHPGYHRLGAWPVP